jgi:hypothetical protein
MKYIDKPVESGIILKRVVEIDRQVVATNVKHSIVCHSPDGFEWGYGGSGPSELALNLAELVVQKATLQSPQGVQCSMLAWDTAYNVKQLLIVNMPEEGGFIPWKLVCYAVLDNCNDTNRIKLQKYIDTL